MSESTEDRAEKIRKLEDIIKSLHGGTQPAAVKAQLKDIVRRTDSAEIAAMEQQLMAGGMPVDEVRSMCDLHAEVLKEILTEPPRRDFPPGHPIDTFRRENGAIHELAEQLQSIIGRLRQLPESEEWRKTIVELRQKFNELMDIDKHYQRKENLLFSRLEAHGITGPSKVMWAKDDEVRQLLKRVDRVLSKDPLVFDEALEMISTTAEPALNAIRGMIYKEENILFPMALDALTDEDWGQIWRDTPNYGWCLVEPGEGYNQSAPAGQSASAQTAEQALAFSSGSLKPDELRAVLATLPLELTFVDAEDRVALFFRGTGADIQAEQDHLGAQGSKLPSAGKRSHGAKDIGRLPRGPTRRGRILDQFPGQVRQYPLFCRARRKRNVSGHPGSDSRLDASPLARRRTPPAAVRLRRIVSNVVET